MQEKQQANAGSLCLVSLCLEDGLVVVATYKAQAVESFARFRFSLAFGGAPVPSEVMLPNDDADSIQSMRASVGSCVNPRRRRRQVKANGIKVVSNERDTMKSEIERKRKRDRL
jgi:hypothetical protein